ncbi:hypothetical protein [Halofilum ochraceum]|uniref:hypothetical protein n=1 Tax=Halofilum ochraceum TaxID=1611323 RepID=UPI0008D9116B|nr:hypothetical protein [Halofilum ochraceum]
MKRTYWWLPLVLGGLLGGCATSSSSFEDGFGDSVRAAMNEQTWSEGEDAPPLRGTKAEEAIYRYHVGDESGQTDGATMGLSHGE